MTPAWQRNLAFRAVLTLLSALSLPAQEAARRVDLHGFGGWAYGRTNGNDYQFGNSDGNTQRGSFALNISSHPTQALSIVGQAFWQQTDDGTEAEIDYAFAEWRVSDALRLRMGKVKQPFGIYNEVFDVGTLRPFLMLPQAVYGPVGFVAEGYQGVGLRGDKSFGSDWRVAYDLYSGGITLEEFKAPLLVLMGEEPDEAEERETTSDLLGSRIVISTPLRGLSFGGSAYSGKHRGSHDASRQWAAGAQAEYVTDAIWLRGEVAHQAEGDELTANAFYAEAAYFLTPKWQAAATFNVLDVNLNDVDVSVGPSLQEHREIAVGLNYWFVPELAIKASLHSVNGNRLAGPLADDLWDAISDGALNRRTRLFQLGAQFSF